MEAAAMEATSRAQGTVRRGAMKMLLIGLVVVCVAAAATLAVLAAGRRAQTERTQRRTDRLEHDTSTVQRDAARLTADAKALDQSRSSAARQIQDAVTAADAATSATGASIAEIRAFTDAINRTVNHPLTAAERAEIAGHGPKLEADLAALRRDVAALQKEPAHLQKVAG
jgi:hypothetical protein